MNAVALAQVSHESETQRQYPRLALPARAVVNGKRYEVTNLSTGGIAIKIPEGSFARGAAVAIELQLSFGTFSFNLPLEAEVVHYNAEDKALGCRFVNLKPEQVSFLSHAVKSYISGEIVTSGNILNVAQRNNFTKARAATNKNVARTGFWRQLPGLLAVLVIGLLITTLIAENLYNSVFVVKAGDAVVSGPVITVKAAATGVYRSKLDPGLTLVRQNQTIATITPLSGGAAVQVLSPCNCYINKTTLAAGDLVTQNQPVASLLPIDAKPWVIAEIDVAQGKKLTPQSKANVSIFGSKNTYTGHVVSMESPLSDLRAVPGRAVLMKIALDQKVPVDFVNRLADVTFNLK